MAILARSSHNLSAAVVVFLVGLAAAVGCGEDHGRSVTSPALVQAVMRELETARPELKSERYLTLCSTPVQRESKFQSTCRVVTKRDAAKYELNIRDGCWVGAKRAWPRGRKETQPDLLPSRLQACF